MRLAVALTALAAAGALAGVAVAGQPKKEIKPAVQARAKTISLRVADLAGSGWTPSPSSPNRGSTPTCPYYNPDQSDLTENGDLDSPIFKALDGSEAQSSVGIFVSAAEAKTAYARVVRPGLPRCVADLLRRSGGGSIAVVSTSKLAFPHIGDRTAAYRTSLVVTSGKQKVPVKLDLVALNKGAVDVAFFFTGVGNGFSRAFESRAVIRVASRI